MKLCKLLFLVCSVLAGFAGDCAAVSEIVVTGQGYENIEPNRVTVRISITTLEDKQIESAEKNAMHYEKVATVLDRMGYGRDSIYTRRYGVRPHYRKDDDER